MVTAINFSNRLIRMNKLKEYIFLILFFAVIYGITHTVLSMAISMKPTVVFVDRLCLDSEFHEGENVPLRVIFAIKF
jgi:hypothetical protein